MKSESAGISSYIAGVREAADRRHTTKPAELAYDRLSAGKIGAHINMLRDIDFERITRLEFQKNIGINIQRILDLTNALKVERDIGFRRDIVNRINKWKEMASKFFVEAEVSEFQTMARKCGINLSDLDVESAQKFLDLAMRAAAREMDQLLPEWQAGEYNFLSIDKDESTFSPEERREASAIDAAYNAAMLEIGVGHETFEPVSNAKCVTDKGGKKHYSGQIWGSEKIVTLNPDLTVDTQSTDVMESNRMVGVNRAVIHASEASVAFAESIGFLPADAFKFIQNITIEQIEELLSPDSEKKITLTEQQKKLMIFMISSAHGCWAIQQHGKSRLEYFRRLAAGESDEAARKRMHQMLRSGDLAPLREVKDEYGLSLAEVFLKDFRVQLQGWSFCLARK